MSYVGKVQNGTIILPPGTNLPNGAEVEVVPLPRESKTQIPARKRLDDFVGIFDDLPTDLARNHDHYLHGLPKR